MILYGSWTLVPLTSLPIRMRLSADSGQIPRYADLGLGALNNPYLELQLGCTNLNNLSKDGDNKYSKSPDCANPRQYASTTCWRFRKADMLSKDDNLSRMQASTC